MSDPTFSANQDQYQSPTILDTSNGSTEEFSNLSTLSNKCYTISEIAAESGNDKKILASQDGVRMKSSNCNSIYLQDKKI